jgi:hypothetical protein
MLVEAGSTPTSGLGFSDFLIRYLGSFVRILLSTPPGRREAKLLICHLRVEQALSEMLVT